MITFKFSRNASNQLEVSEDGTLFATISDPNLKVSAVPGSNLLQITYLGGPSIYISTARAQIQLPGEDTPTSLSAAAIAALSFEQVLLKLKEGLAPVSAGGGGGEMTSTGLKTVMKGLPNYDAGVDQAVIIKGDALSLQPVPINTL